MMGARRHTKERSKGRMTLTTGAPGDTERNGAGRLGAYGPTGCVEKAESLARQWGVDACYAGCVHIGNAVNQLLWEIHLRGLAPPQAVYVDAEPFLAGERRRVELYPAHADCHDEVIYLNPRSFWFRSRESIRKYARRAFRRGRIATDDPIHILRHEYAHILHKREAGRRLPHLRAVPAESLEQERESRGRIYLESLHTWDARDADAQTAAARVSGRASCSPLEFVAEVCAGLWGGRSFEAPVMAGYRRYFGPCLTPDRREQAGCNA